MSKRVSKIRLVKFIIFSVAFLSLEVLISSKAKADSNFKITSISNKSTHSVASKLYVKWNGYNSAKEYCVYAVGKASKKSTRKYYTKSKEYTIPSYSFSVGTQYLYVLALNSSGKTLASKNVEITITGANKTLSSPNISYSTNSNGKLTFSASASYATHYYYSIYDKTSKKYLVNNACTASLSNVTRTGLTKGHNYSITVTACCGNCYKSSSLTYSNLDTSRIKKTTASFTYSGAVTSKPDKVSISVNGLSKTGKKVIMNKSNMAISWKKVSRASGYYIVVYEYRNGKNIVKGKVASSYCKNNTYKYTVSSNKLCDGYAYNIKVYSTNSKYPYGNGAQYGELDVFINATSYNSGYVMMGSAHNDYDGKSGDSSGQETVVKNYVDAPWYYHIRPRSKALGEKLATTCEFLADNRNVNVGYSGNMDSKKAYLGFRYTLFNAVAAANGNLEKLRYKTYDADCSGFVSSCLVNALYGSSYLKYLKGTLNTNELEKFLVTSSTTGQKLFDVVQTAKTNSVNRQFYTPINYRLLQRGDIVLRPANKAHLFDSKMDYGHAEVIVRS